MPAIEDQIVKNHGQPNFKKWNLLMTRYLISISTIIILMFSFGCAHVKRTDTSPPEIVLKNNEKALWAYMAGQLADQEGDYELAVKYYQQVLTIDPDARQVRINLVQNLIRLSYFDQAAQAYRQLVAEQPPDQKTKFMLGQLHEASGNTRLAEKVYRQTVAMGEELSGPFTRLGILLFQRDRPKEAISFLKKSLAIDPNEREARLALMRYYFSQDKWDASQVLLEQGLEHDPNNLEWLAYLAQLFKEQEKDEQAKDVFLKIIRIFPDYPPANHFLANYYLQTGEWKSAVRFLEREVESDPDDLQNHRNLGLVYYKIGRQEDARRLLYAVVQKNSDDALAHYLLGVIYKNRKLFYLAEHEFKAAITHNSLFEEAYLSLAAIHIHNHELEEALSVYAVASLKFKNSPNLFLRYGVLLLKVKDYEYAVTILDKARMLAPRDPSILFQLGRAYHGLNDINTATYYWKRVIELDDQFAEAYNHLGYSYAEQNNQLKQAVAWLERAIALDPENGYYLDSLAWAYYKQGRYRVALKTIIEAQAALKNKGLTIDAVIFEHLGDIYYKLNQLIQAREAWERALSLDDKNHALHQKLKKLPSGVGE